MINISSYVNLGNEHEWNFFLQWYKENISTYERYFSPNDDRVKILNKFKETIAYFIRYEDGNRYYCVDRKLHTLLRTSTQTNIDRLIQIEAAVKVMLEANPCSGSKSHDPEYTTWVACDKYAAVSDAYYGREGEKLNGSNYHSRSTRRT